MKGNLCFKRKKNPKLIAKITMVNTPTSRTEKRIISVPNSMNEIEGETH